MIGTATPSSSSSSVGSWTCGAAVAVDGKSAGEPPGYKLMSTNRTQSSAHDSFSASGHRSISCRDNCSLCIVGSGAVIGGPLAEDEDENVEWIDSL